MGPKDLHKLALHREPCMCDLSVRAKPTPTKASRRPVSAQLCTPLSGRCDKSLLFLPVTSCQEPHIRRHTARWKSGTGVGGGGLRLLSSPSKFGSHPSRTEHPPWVPCGHLATQALCVCVYPAPRGMSSTTRDLGSQGSRSHVPGHIPTATAPWTSEYP